MAEGGRVGNMQVGDGGISNTVEVTGFSKKMSQELMEMYFENSRRSGGGDVEEVRISDEVAYITFKEAEVAQKVASRSNHQVDGHRLTVTLFYPLPPKPCYQNRVLIQGVNNAITEELLRNFLETKTKAEVTEFLYGEEDGNVVVTLSDNIDIVQLGKIFQESSIEGVFLKAARVAISNCILVQNLHPSSSHDVILYYFENKRRSGGGDVERIEMKTEERYCLIYFEDPSVIDRVLGQSHNVDGVDFEINLHHECLGRRSSRKKSDLYLRMSSPGNKDNATLEDENADNQANDKTSSSVSSNLEKESDFVEVREWQANDDSATLEDENADNQAKDKTSSSVSSNPEKESDFVEVQEWQANDENNCTLPLWIKYKSAPDKKIIKCMKNIPCSWNFHLYWNFYTKTEPGKQMLHEILNKYNCSVAVFAEDEDLFLFEISEKIFEQESDVVQLIHVVLDSVHKCAQQFLYLDNILVDQRIQGDVLQVVRQRKELDIARFELMGQQDLDALCVICTEKDQTLVHDAVTEIIHIVKECFENHEEIIDVDHKWQRVMKTYGYLQKLCEKYPNVTIISDKTEAAIMLKGPKDQSKPAADHFLEILGTASSEVQEEIFSPGCQFEIFTYPEMCGYIDNITMKLSIVWIPNHQTKKIHLFSKKSEKIKVADKLIRGCVQERLYPLAKDQTVFSTRIIRSLEELKKMHTGKMVFSSSHKGLLLTATDDIFESIDDAVQEIICKETDFPCQWEKFEMRLEVEKENKCFSRTLYTIMDVSPGQMQYIVGNKDERDSLLEQLGKSNFRGVFELGLLRIFLQKDEDIRKIVENPNYGIHLKKEVIQVLNTHIHADQVIKEKKLSQFGMEDVLQAQELGHLECIKSWRVKIYIHKSGKGVSIVGREVDKYIESICKALEQVNKNKTKSERTEDVASSVSETKLSNMKFDTDRYILSETSLEHAEKREEVKKYEDVMVCKKEFGCTKHVTQMLTDSDYAAVLATSIPEVAVNYISNEVVFRGPSEAVMKAECHLKQYLKSKGFWHEVELAESLIVYKILKFEEDLQRKIPEVYIKFHERKVIFIGEEKLLQTSEDELRKFEQSIKRADKTYDKITGNYLKLEDVQRSIWEQFEKRRIKCCWQVIGCSIRLFYKSDKELKAAMSALKECIVISHLSIRSESDLQEFENCPDVKKLINQNQGRLYRELIDKGDCVVYVGTHEVIVQIEKLHCTYIADQKYKPPKHSLQILLSQPLMAYVRKYLIENMKLMFQVNIQNLNDLSGINISGAEDNVQNAVSELQNQIKQMSVDIYPLRSPEITNTIDREVKEIVATVEEETKTVIEIVSLPRRGKDTMRVKVYDKLDVCLVYGSTPGREVDIQLIPVNNSFFPVCLASVDIMDKGVKMHAEALARYFAQCVEKQEIKKPEAFQFAYDDSGSSHHIVYFVMPVDLNDIEEFKEKFKYGLLAVLNYSSQKKRTSLSIPLEMHEKLSAKQMVTIIMETIKSFLDQIPQHTSIKEIMLCSVERYNQSLLRNVLDALIPDEQSVGDYAIDDFFGCEEGVDSHVDIAIVTGTLLEQQVEVIVNSTTKELNLADGYLTKIILDAAGSTIQDECRNSYQEGIKIGEIAVTSAGNLKFRRIFHGALCLPDVNGSHLLSLRSLMKNCLKKAQEEKCRSIAFPALGIGRLNYPVDVVAKEMFRAVTTYAMRFGVKRVKFVLPEKNTDCVGAFKEIEKTRNKLLQDSQDGNPSYEASLNDCNIKIAVVVGKKVTMCDVVIVPGNPTTGTPVADISLKSPKYYLFETEKKIAINRDPRKWSETLYLPLENGVNLLEEELRYALLYVKLMKFTSCAVDLSHLKKEDDCKSMMEKVFQVVNECKSDPGDLERVTILISDDILQKQILFSEDSVTASYRNNSLIDRFTGFAFKGWFGSKSQMTWKMLPDGRLTYLRITGMDTNAVKRSYDAVQKGFRKLPV